MVEAKKDVPRATGEWSQMVRTVSAGQTKLVFWVNYREVKPLLARILKRKK